LEAQFRRLRPAVVTVWSDLGQGSGSFVAVHPDGMAMLLTSDHVIAGARALAVQTDATHKVAAILLSEDPNLDTAALAANLSGAPDVTAVTLASAATVAAIPAGAPVFTIGSRHQQAKVLTPGIVGQNDAQGFNASTNLGLGNAGGPLFAADGAVIGITAADATGLGRIIKITAAGALLRRAEARFESIGGSLEMPRAERALSAANRSPPSSDQRERPSEKWRATLPAALLPEKQPTAN
jgi:S1-C subfamily serine protease